ncbi:MAG: tetratricopeptide repeat protein [Candidatus Latescibacteria bacterium]|nr:tetratricopeptide repeat protein [bacterium]MBD3423505.1 tetratricopeptide repeat protein [Candidatus Latescibacterota bacterium]
MYGRVSLLAIGLTCLLAISIFMAGPARALPQFKDERGFDKKLTPAEIEYQSAQQYMKSESYYEAIDHLKKAVKLEPEFFEAWSLLGKAQARIKNFSESVKSYKKANEIKPGNTNVIGSLGDNYLKLNNLDKAQEYFKMLTARDSLDYFGNIRLGFISKQKEEWDEAVDYFRRALKVKPEDVVVMGTLAGIYGEMDEPEKQIEFLKRAVDTEPENYTMMKKLASAYFSNKQYKEAVPIYEKLVEVYPDLAAFHKRLGFALSQSKGDMDRAAEELEQANIISGGDSQTHALLALIYNENKKWDDAIAAARGGLALNDGNDAFLLYQLGVAVSKKGRYEEAINHFQKAVNIGTEPWKSSSVKQIDRQKKLIEIREAKKEQQMYE